MRLTVLCLVLVGAAPLGRAQGGWLDNLRWALDLSSRAVHATGMDGAGFQSVVGLDLHKVVSAPDGDIGTLVAQLYLTRVDGLPATPGVFDDSHDAQLIFRILNFNFTRWGGRGVNFRVGHYEVPYGLEQIQETNGTLRQYLSPANLGLKADWGVSLNGQLPRLEYEVGWSRGSGNEIHDVDGNYVVAGRVGVPREENLVLGLSALKAQMIGGVERVRYGMDMRLALPRFEFLAEMSGGEDDDGSITNGLVELNTHSADERSMAWAQMRSLTAEPGTSDRVRSGVLGAAHRLSNGLTLSAQWTHEFEDDKEDLLLFQVRKRF